MEYPWTAFAAQYVLTCLLLQTSRTLQILGLLLLLLFVPRFCSRLLIQLLPLIGALLRVFHQRLMIVGCWLLFYLHPPDLLISLSRSAEARLGVRLCLD